MRYLIDVKYNPDTDNPIYRFFDEETQQFDELIIPREDSYSYFLQRDMSEADIRETLRQTNPDSLERLVEISPVTKHNLFTEKEETMMKVKMTSALDVRGYRFKGCHEGHIRRVTRHMIDKQWYMGMPYDEENQIIGTEINPKHREMLIESGYPEDVVDQMLKWTFTKIPEMSTVAFDIETESFATVLPNPMYASTPIISASFKFHNIKTDEVFGLVLILDNYLRRLDDNSPNPLLNELVIQGKVKMEMFSNEYDLIMRIIEVLNDPDYPLCVTYYGEAFDMPYLFNRAINLGVNQKRLPFTAYRTRSPVTMKGAGTDWRVRMKNKMHIDLLQFFAQPVIMNYVYKGKYNRLGLDNVAEALLGRKKVPYDGTINQLSLGNLAYYNYIDTDLTLDLIRQDDYLPLKVIFMFMRIGRQDYYDAAHRAIGNKILNLIQGYLVEHDILIPNQTDLSVVGTAHSSPDIKGKGYRGAIVIPYVMGVVMDVQSLDFGSLYPSMIRERNISFDTINCGHPECKDNTVPELPHHICTKKIGILPALIGCIKDIRLKLFKPWSVDESLTQKERNTYKAIEQAQKVFVNASYGVFGNEAFGLKCTPVAESITAWARDAITQVVIQAELFGGNDLVMIAGEHDEEPLDAIVHISPDERVTQGGDTDSGHFKGLTKEQQQFLIDFSDRELRVVLEAEDPSPVMVSYKKKNYIKVTPKLKVIVKGMLGKKRNTPDIAVNCFNEFKDILVKIVTKELVLNQVREETVSLIRSYYDKIWHTEGDIDDYAFEMRMTKGVSEYKARPQHVAAAIKWADHIRSQSAALRTASDSMIVPAGSFIRFVKGTEGHVRITKSGKRASNVKCDPVPVEIASKDDIAPIYYHENLLSVMGQVMEAIGINKEEVKTSDPEQSILESFF